MFRKGEIFLKNPDTRVQMTKRLLKENLLSLLEEKPIGRVTVKEIVDAAGINRGTFYLHYDTPLSLLKEIENDFIRDNMELFESFMREGYDRSYLSLLFESIWKNRDTLCILLGPNGDPSFLQSLREFSRERTIDEWNTEFPRYSRNQLNFLYEFVFPGFTNLMVSWFKNDHGVSAKEFTHRMERLGHYALLAVEEFR